MTIYQGRKRGIVNTDVKGASLPLELTAADELVHTGHKARDDIGIEVSFALKMFFMLPSTLCPLFDGSLPQLLLIDINLLINQ